MQENNKQLKWSIVTFILAALSVLAMFSQSRSLTVSGLLESLGESGPLAILAALICMAGYIVCEGIALWLMLRHNGYKKRPLNGIMYAAADIYCSAITPSATGGQPVCAWFMSRDGVPMGIITAILMIHLIMHSFASVTIGILSLIIDPSVFLGFSLLSKFFIVLGFLLLTGIATIFIVLFSKEKEVYGIGCKIIAWLKKKNIIKRDAYWRDWTKNMLHECAESLQSMRGMGRFMGIIYLLNVLQRLSQTLVSVILFTSNPTFRSGLGPGSASRVFVTQIFSTIGSSWVPIPGGMGVADLLLFDGLGAILDREHALRLELLTRSFSFYMCVLLSLVIVLIGYIQRRRQYATVGRRH